MLIIGLTGGIASGKSLVTSTLQNEEHIPVLDCDLIARQVVERGTSARKKLVEVFKDIVDLELSDGSLNRKALGKVVFSDPEKRKLLQSITGRAIFYELLKQLFYHWLIGTPLVVIDAPTLYETKFLIRFCSEIIVVAVSKETQLERLMSRDGSSEEDATARIQAQIPIEEKVKLADIILWNEGSKEELIDEVRILAKRLKKKAYGARLLFSGPGVAFFCMTIIVLWHKSSL